MTPDLIILDRKKLSSIILLVGSIVFAAALTWFGVRWQLGDMLANLTATTDPNAQAIASSAQNLAPSDPLPSWLRASTDDEDASSAVEKFEHTVRLSPYDYRWRVDLGKALEQDDKPDRAEAELKRAVELAPSYAHPRWHLGNFYLRQNRADDAFVELKRVVEFETEYREQVFSIAWEYFNKDPAQLEKLTGDEPGARAGLAHFFAARGRAADSLRNWNMLSDRDKTLYASTVRAIAQGLYEQRHFKEALEFSKQNGNDKDAKAGVVTNPGFESTLTDSETSWFGWQILRNDPKIEVSTDGKVKHLGERSLRVTFKGYTKPALTNVTQTVVVEPTTRYRLRFYVRTENLRSVGGPLLEVVSAYDGKAIVQSKPFTIGTSDWQEYSIDVTTPENCDGIQIRTIRTFCGDGCQINGTFWYDDFDLVKL